MQVAAHNMLAQFTDRQLNISSKEKGKKAEKLSSGYRINRAADDAAGLTISEEMRQQIRGLKRGGQNTQEGISWLQVADGAMSEITSIIQRIRELAVQASNDTNTPADRAALNNETVELKKEINKICTDTEFNTQDVFDNSYVTMDVQGTPDDLQIYDAVYDDATGDVTYGGFVFHGNRIPWTDVNANMVRTDPITGRQIFNGGSYSYTDPSTGYQLSIQCEDGVEPPEITRKIDISADEGGIYIDGKQFDWTELYDEEERAFSDGNMHSGAWMLEYEGASLAFFVGSDVRTTSDMAKALNSCSDGKVTYSWQTKYVGTKNEQAVDAMANIKEIRISNKLAQAMGNDPGLSFTVRAGKDAANGEDGIWIEQNGQKITNSFKSWNELMDNTSPANVWMEGQYVNGSSGNGIHTYWFGDKANPEFQFNFKLSDITSVDSVIDGLDGMVIGGGKLDNNYTLNLNVTLDKNLVKASANSKNLINFPEEVALGRDFDQKEVDNVTNNNLTYDATNGDTKLVFSHNGIDVISYQGNTADMAGRMESDLQSYLSFVLRKKTTAAMMGLNPQATDLNLTSGSLTDTVGAGNITTSGCFDQTVTMNSSMVKTDGKGGFRPGQDGLTYPTAFIDFQKLSNLDRLEGLGFNSTCKTCDNHYSVMFVNGSGKNYAQTGSGYKYNFKAQGNNYTLQVDLSSLKNNGVTNGAGLSNALVEITSRCFDFHYTQYAAAGSKLYIYDNRQQNAGARAATFDTAPFMGIDTDVFQTDVVTADGRKISLEYTYNYGDIKDNMIVEMQQNNAGGKYVKMNDGTYEIYDPMNLDHQGKDFYDMQVSFKDNSGAALTGPDDLIQFYTKNAVNKMITGSKIQLDAYDYTYIKRLKGEEKTNIAVRPMFESELIETPCENGLHIQNSSREGDFVLIPRFALNTVVLRLYRAGDKTFEQAQETISSADYALGFLNDRRSMYGAYMNRLEHTYNANANARENTQAAESRIRDADMADEIVDYSKHNILEQAGQSMLAQANQGMQGVLSLLQI